jgi:transcriptional regulator with XRE-family HTH domain
MNFIREQFDKRNRPQDQKKERTTSEFSKNLKLLLQRSKCTQKRAAEIAGVNPSVICGWTSGSQPRDLRPVLKLTEALGADFQFILTGIHSQKSDAAPRIGDVIFEPVASISGIFQIEVKRVEFIK